MLLKIWCFLFDVGHPKDAHCGTLCCRSSCRIFRRAEFVEGISQREAARRFGLSRTTVAKMMQFFLPPGYRRRQVPRRPRLQPYIGIIDQILDQDASAS